MIDREKRHFLTRVMTCAAAMGIAPRAALAHRVHEGLSVISANPRTGMLEVTHRLQDHDLAPALTKAYGKRVEPLGKEGQLLLRDYIAKNFRFTALDKMPIALEFVGVEAENDFVYIYFEAKMPKNLKGFTIKNSLLTDYLPDQRNLVNVRIAGKTQSLLFLAGDDAKTVTFAP